MNSKKGGKSFPSAVVGSGTSFKKSPEASGSGKGYPYSEQLRSGIEEVSSDCTQDGEWAVIAKKKNKVGAATAKQWGPSHASKSLGQAGQGLGSNGGAGRSANNWTQSFDSQRPAGRGMPPHPSTVPPPLQHGWQWAARGGSAVNPQKNGESVSNISEADQADNLSKDTSDDDDDAIGDDSDEDFSDDYDSDASQKSHETRKMNKWFKGFFENLSKLTLDEIHEQTRQWHCPACQNGPGAIEWYNGLQPLMTHAKTRSTRARLHRELAVLLDEEFRRRGTSISLAGEAFGKWNGLHESTTDREIVWPPMVIVMNTLLEKDQNDKWIGMGNQELLEYFKGYAAKKARHSYGPHGHRGMSVLIFESSPVGYTEAERIHMHFAKQGLNRQAWEQNRKLFYPGGKRQLYGYLAKKEDLDIFNQHSPGKSRLKFEMRSYQEMVVIPMKQMSEDNQQLSYLQRKVVKQKQISKALEDTVVAVTQKLRETNEDNKIVRLRTMMQHEESKEMMDFQERFFKEQIEKIHRHTEEKEKEYEKLLQEERAKAKLAESNSGNTEDSKLRKKKIENFIESQVRDVEVFEARREDLIRSHDEKKIALRRKHLAEEVELEKEFDAQLTLLMEEHAPISFQNPNGDIYKEGLQGSGQTHQGFQQLQRHSSLLLPASFHSVHQQSMAEDKEAQEGHLFFNQISKH
ncbi:Protein suppresor of gene silencing 3 like [Apostasia shenzhenica]|uniref:Protein suppresor of gene silencing 3 like n=1 Tax=Apostasia shenzhenica TaxID=1088818 RepID=A0A2I0BG33_9ASPA|nr:Protein suppresor of gene silencing 3 like [Apostasia shenzhenica]